jgi:hypothetical protein
MNMSEIYVPEDQRTTAWYIFYKKFRCRLPNIQTYSKEYIRMYGMPSSGDPNIDRQLANELVDRLLPISEIATYLDAGANIRIVNIEDTKEIYERITDHLNWWKKEMEESYHPVKTPIKDLQMLDALAFSVHPHAKHQFSTEIVESIMARRMSSVMRVSRANIMGGASLPKVTSNEAGEQLPSEDTGHKHVSMADLFVKHSPATVKVNKWG